MDVGGAYGGGKAGAPFDALTFAQRPQVIVKGACMFCSLIVFGCMSNYGYQEKDDKEICVLNKDSSACQYGNTIGVVGFLASIGFLVGEYLFEQMSSVKTRKHYVLGDLGFSGFWTFLYFVGFFYLWSAWNKSERPDDGVNSIRAVILFSFLSIFTWAAASWLAYQRFKQGADTAFNSSFEADPSGAGQAYTSYPDATDDAYQEPPFGQQQQQQRGMGDYQAPSY